MYLSRTVDGSFSLRKGIHHSGTGFYYHPRGSCLGSATALDIGMRVERERICIDPKKGSL